MVGDSISNIHIYSDSEDEQPPIDPGDDPMLIGDPPYVPRYVDFRCSQVSAGSKLFKTSQRIPVGKVSFFQPSSVFLFPVHTSDFLKRDNLTLPVEPQSFSRLEPRFFWYVQGPGRENI